MVFTVLKYFLSNVETSIDQTTGHHRLTKLMHNINLMEGLSGYLISYVIQPLQG